jgi:hypothetical protein
VALQYNCRLENAIKEICLIHEETLILMRVIDSTIYEEYPKDNETFLQEFFHISHDKALSLINSLIEYGVCSIDKKTKKIKSNVPIFQYHIDDSRLTPAYEYIHKQVKDAFLQKINRESTRKLSVTGFRVGAVSDETLSKIEHISKQYFYEVGKLMSSDKDNSKENVFIQTLGVVSIEEGTK